MTESSVQVQYPQLTQTLHIKSHRKTSEHENNLTMGDFKVGVYCTKCTLNTGVNTNFEITHCDFITSWNKCLCFRVSSTTSQDVYFS
jgi:hypothetical protein